MSAQPVLAFPAEDLQCPAVAAAVRSAEAVLAPLKERLASVGVAVMANAFLQQGFSGAALSSSIYLDRKGGKDGVAPVFVCFNNQITSEKASEISSSLLRYFSPDNDSCPPDVLSAVAPLMEELRSSAAAAESEASADGSDGSDHDDEDSSSSPEQVAFKEALAGWVAAKEEACEADPEVIKQRRSMALMHAIAQKDLAAAEEAWAVVPSISATKDVLAWPDVTLASTALRTGDRGVIAWVFDRAMAAGESVPLQACCRYAAGVELLQWLHEKYGPLPAEHLSAPFKGETHDLPSHISLSELQWRLDHGADVRTSSPQLFGIIATAKMPATDTRPAEEAAAASQETEAVLRLLYEAGCPMRGAKAAMVLSPWSNGGELVLDGPEDPVEVAARDPGNIGGLLTREEVGLNYAVQRGSLQLVQYFVSKGASPRYGDDTPLLAAVSGAYAPAPHLAPTWPNTAQAMIAYLVESCGADVKARNSRCLMQAATNAGNWALVKQLVAMGADLKVQANPLLLTLLQEGNRGADDGEDSSTDSPSTCSCPIGDWLLEEGGADPEAVLQAAKRVPYFDLSECRVPPEWLQAKIVPRVPQPLLVGLGWRQPLSDSESMSGT